jgi:hypothetical protein
VADPLEQLQQLRELRQFKGRDLSLGTAIARVREQVGKSDRKLTQLIELWRELIPEHLQLHATPTSIRGGTLHVEVNCAATAYEVDRLMRGGMEQTLRLRFNGTLVRVKCAQKKR